MSLNHPISKYQIKEASFNDFLKAKQWCKNLEEMQNWAGNLISEKTTVDELREYWNESVSENKNKIALRLQVNSEFHGYAELGNIDYIHNNARIEKFIVGPNEIRHQGFGKSFLNLLLRLAQDTLNLKRIDLLVIERNHFAINLYKKCEFVIEGRMKSARHYDGKYYDMILMSKLFQNKKNK